MEELYADTYDVVKVHEEVLEVVCGFKGEMSIVLLPPVYDIHSRHRRELEGITIR